MSDVVTGMLRVPGANLYYEERHEGPVILMIHAGTADADSFNALAERLTGYRVVTYDRRGCSRSIVTGTNKVQLVADHSDDAHRLLASLGSEPAYVVGSSSGAMIALDLAIRHPEQVKAVVAHEPPVRRLIENTRLEPLQADYRRDGATATLQKFA